MVCAENFLIYRNGEQPEVRAVIPRRTALSGDRGVLITAATTFRQKSGFHIFVQVRGTAGWLGGRGSRLIFWEAGGIRLQAAALAAATGAAGRSSP